MQCPNRTKNATRKIYWKKSSHNKILNFESKHQNILGLNWIIIKINLLKYYMILLVPFIGQYSETTHDLFTNIWFINNLDLPDNSLTSLLWTVSLLYNTVLLFYIVMLQSKHNIEVTWTLELHTWEFIKLKTYMEIK